MSFRPYRNTMNDMTFEKADRIEANKSKKMIEFFAACQERLFYYGKEDEAFYFEMVFDHLNEGGKLDPIKVQRILGL